MKMTLISGINSCFSLMGKYKRVYWITLLLEMILSYGGDMMFATLNKNVINAVTASDFNAFTATLWIGAAALAAFLLSVLVRYFNMRSIRYIMLDMRKDLFGHMERLSVKYFEKNHSGDSIFRLNSNVEIMKQAYSGHFPNIILGIVGGIASCVFILVLDWRLGLMAILTCVLTFFINVKFASPLRELGGKIQRSESALVSRLSDLLAGFRVIKLFGADKSALGRYDAQNDETASLRVKRVARVGTMDGINHFLNFINTFVLITVGSIITMLGYTDFGTVFAILTVQGNVSGMLLGFGSAWGLMQESVAAAQMIYEVLEEEEEKPDFTDAAKTSKTDAFIEFKNVCFSYDDENTVLNNLNLSVGKGEAAALVGPSGGGKSTVIKLLMLFYKPEKGDIILNGKSISEYTLPQLRDMISYVPQDAYLFDESIKENIRYGRPGASDDEVIKAAKVANAHDFILNLPDGYDTYVGERGESLSGGQRQRIAIARAFLKNAPILLLDEATSALDTENERLVQHSLERLMKNRTTMVVAHRLTTIENSDVIYVIKGGRVVQSGSHDELLKDGGLYKELVSLSGLK